MAMGFKHGSGGGDPLDFQVVNASTEPSAPRENTIWVKTTWVQNGWTFGTDMPLRKSKNKNFATYPYASGTNTSSGVTFTDNGNGTVTVNGTATKDVYFRASRATAEEGMMLLPAGEYIMSGCPAGGSSGTYKLQLITMDSGLDTVATIEDYGIGQAFTLTEDTLCRLNFAVMSGTKVNGLTVYFQIEKGSAKTDFLKGNANGQVWIRPDHSGAVSFEALKRSGKNSIVLQPGEIRMFNESSGWKLQSGCKIYRNGAWSALKSLLYLYNKGGSTGYSFACDENMKQLSSGYTAEAERVTAGSSGITLKTNGRAYDFADIFLTDASGAFKMVDLSKWTKIRIRGTLTGATRNTECVFRVMSAMGTLCTENNVAAKSFTAGTVDATVDISAIDPGCYLGFTVYNDSETTKVITFELTELWLE